MERVFIQTHDAVRVFENASPHALIMKNLQCWGAGEHYRNLPGTGPLFIEDIDMGGHKFNYWNFNKQEVWARQFNPELNWEGKPEIGSWVTNDGGTVWVFGMKTEGLGPITETRNGGKTEVYGNFHIQPFNTVFAPLDMPMHIVKDSSVSLSFTSAYWTPEKNDYRIYVSESQKGETRHLLREQSVGKQNVRMVPLYSSRFNTQNPVAKISNTPVTKTPKKAP
jgi:hypothetical protein